MKVNWKILLIMGLVFAGVGLGSTALYFVKIRPGQAYDRLVAQAHEEMAQKNFPYAEAHLRQAVQRNDRKPEAHLLLAEIYLDHPLQKSATPAAEEERRLGIQHLVWATNQAKGGNPDLLEPQVRIMEYFFATGKLKEARDRAVQVARLDPKNADALYIKALDGLKTNEGLHEAFDSIRALETIEKPLRPRTALLSVWYYSTQGQAEAVQKVLRKALEQAPAPRSDAWARLSVDDQLAVVELRDWSIKTAGDDPDALDQAVHQADAALTAATALIGTPRLQDYHLSRIFTLTESLAADLQKLANRTNPAAPPPAVAALLKRSATVGARACETAIRRQSLDPSIYVLYAQSLVTRRRTADARRVIDQGLDRAKKITNPLPVLEAEFAKLHWLAANLEIGDQKYDAARTHIKELLKSPSSTLQSQGDLLMGYIDMEQGEMIEARKYLQLAARWKPDDPRVQTLLGVYLIRRGEYDEGRRRLNEARQLRGQSDPHEAAAPQYLVLSAWALIRGGFSQDARPIVEELLKNPTTQVVGWELRGEIAMHQKQPREALEEYQKVVNHDPRAVDPQIYLKIADALVALDRWDEARAALARLAGTVHEPEAVRIRYHYEVDHGRQSEARETLAAGRRKFPQDFGLLTEECLALLADQQAPAAEKLVRDYRARYAARLGDKSVQAYLLLAELLEQQKKRAEALRVLNDAADQFPSEPGPLLHQARILLDQGKLDKVEAKLQLLRSLGTARSSIDLYEIRLAMARGNWAEAHQKCQEALRRDPQNSMFALLDADIQQKRGLKSDSLKALKQVENSDRLRGVAVVNEVDLLVSTHPDQAVPRLRDLLNGRPAGDPQRWKLVGALVAVRQWDTAKAEIAKILSEKPPAGGAGPGVHPGSSWTTNRIWAAYVYRLHAEGQTPPDRAELDEAVRLLQEVLDKDPANLAALTQLAGIEAGRGNTAEAESLVRGAIAKDKNATPGLWVLLAAVLATQKEKADLALAELDRALGVFQDDVAVVAAKAQLLQQLGRAAEVVPFVQKVVDAHPDNQGLRRLLAVADIAARRYEPAEANLRQVLEASPNDPAPAQALIDLFAQQGPTVLLANAATIERLAKRHPQEPFFLAARVELYRAQGNWDEALKVAGTLADQEPRLAVGPYLQATIHRVLGRGPQAEEDLRKARDRDPRHEPTLLLLAQIDTEKATPAAFQEADELIAQVLAQRPDSLQGLIQQGYNLYAQGKLDQARDHAAKLAKRFGDSPDVAQLEAAIDYRQEKWPEVIAATARVLAQSPGDVRPVPLRVAALVNAGQLDAARRLADSLVDQKSADPLLEAAKGFYQARQFADAAKYARQALRIGPDKSALAAHQLLGDSLLGQAEQGGEAALFDQAIREYNWVLARNPDHLAALNNKAWILVQYQKKPELAAKLVEPVYQRDPQALPPQFLDTVGLVELESRLPEKAREALQLGLDKDPKSADLHYHMAQALKQIGDLAKAREHAARALDLSTNETRKREIRRLIAALS